MGRRGAGITLSLVLLAAGAGAEPRWAAGAPLELRSGSSLEHRVLGQLAPGEKVEVRERGKGWARVRTASGKEGWVSEAQLLANAPPTERVSELEAELARVRATLGAAEAERESLRRAAGESESREGERSAELDRLLRENARLAAGERWADWLTGAGILAAGMLAGALLRGSLAGRRSSRIRL